MLSPHSPATPTTGTPPQPSSRNNDVVSLVTLLTGLYCLIVPSQEVHVSSYLAIGGGAAILILNNRPNITLKKSSIFFIRAILLIVAVTTLSFAYKEIHDLRLANDTLEITDLIDKEPSLVSTSKIGQRDLSLYFDQNADVHALISKSDWLGLLNIVKRYQTFTEPNQYMHYDIHVTIPNDGPHNIAFAYSQTLSRDPKHNTSWAQNGHGYDAWEFIRNPETDTWRIEKFFYDIPDWTTANAYLTNWQK
jgi:hypothetical protein